MSLLPQPLMLTHGAEAAPPLIAAIMKPKCAKCKVGEPPIKAPLLAGSTALDEKYAHVHEWKIHFETIWFDRLCRSHVASVSQVMGRSGRGLSPQSPSPTKKETRP
jgi:hypothetical protein